MLRGGTLPEEVLIGGLGEGEVGRVESLMMAEIVRDVVSSPGD